MVGVIETLKANITFKEFIFKYPLYLQTILSLSIGCSIFFLVADASIVNPKNTSWLMQGGGDPVFHFLGWKFFRLAPLLQWPFGANPAYGMGISSSVVFSDSIPLLAFIFKPFNPWLPDPFQYFGLWIFGCFLLQSFFACRLLANATEDKVLQITGSMFFVIAPFFLFRLVGHFALMGQWVILAALCLYFKKEYSDSAWGALLGITALIHFYLLVMVLMIWAADLYQRLMIKEMNYKQTVYAAAGCIGATLFIMWFAGYFMVEKSEHAFGFGYFRMNLLSPISPDGWSGLLKYQLTGDGEYEGFNYLGIGILVLSLFPGYLLIRKKIHLHKRQRPLYLLCLVLLALALSKKIAVGPYDLMSYHIPSWASKLTQMIRSSGRLFWPVSYLIYFAIFSIVFSRTKRRTAMALCLFLFVFQLIDSKHPLSGFKNRFTDCTASPSPLRSEEWRNIAQNYKKIFVVPPDSIVLRTSDKWWLLPDFAADHDLPINSGLFGRYDIEKLNREKERLIRSIRDNNLDPDALYFFEDANLWQAANRHLSSSDLSATKDGFRFIAPNLKATSSIKMKKTGWSARALQND